MDAQDYLDNPQITRGLNQLDSCQGVSFFKRECEEFFKLEGIRYQNVKLVLRFIKNVGTGGVNFSLWQGRNGKVDRDPPCRD